MADRKTDSKVRAEDLQKAVNAAIAQVEEVRALRPENECPSSSLTLQELSKLTRTVESIATFDDIKDKEPATRMVLDLQKVRDLVLSLLLLLFFSPKGFL
jgi:hypothetical protein